MKRKLFFKVLRIVLAAGLMVFLLSRIGLVQLRAVLETRHPLYFLLLAGMVLLDAALRAGNWGALLAARGHHLTLREMIFNYMAGAFFGTFIPSSLGTDVTRAVMVSRRNRVGGGDSALAMIVLNLMGLLALSIIGLVSAFLLLHMNYDRGLPILIMILCAAYLALFPMLMRGTIPFHKVLARIPRIAPLLDKIAGFSAALAHFKRYPRVMARILAVAILNQAIAIAIVFIAAQALGVDISLLFCVAVVPVIALSRLIPISIAGLGGEQGVFVLLLSHASVTEAESFLISLVISLANLGFALLGGIVYMVDGCRSLVRGPDDKADEPPAGGVI